MLMRYLLDTDAFSDLVRGVPSVKARFSSRDCLRFASPQ
jgi:predicted nucleic acid-binding protein